MLLAEVCRTVWTAGLLLRPVFAAFCFLQYLFALLSTWNGAPWPSLRCLQEVELQFCVYARPNSCCRWPVINPKHYQQRPCLLVVQFLCRLARPFQAAGCYWNGVICHQQRYHWLCRPAMTSATMAAPQHTVVFEATHPQDGTALAGEAQVRVVLSTVANSTAGPGACIHTCVHHVHDVRAITSA